MKEQQKNKNKLVKKNTKPITITKVLSRNFIMDFVSKFQNMLGLNLTAYEKMIQEGISQIQKELKQKQKKMGWFRYEISELSNGAIAIMFYGVEEE